MQPGSAARLLLRRAIELRAQRVPFLAERAQLPLRRLPGLGRALELPRVTLLRRTRLVRVGVGVRVGVRVRVGLGLRA